MEPLILGLHHITALAADPQKNVNFYAGILGLRLVKKTINFDAPDVYHLYYGNKTGAPGTILTFFPFPGIPKGQRGKGQLTTISFSISKISINYWIKRLTDFNISFDGPFERFSETVLTFQDHEGLGLELIANQEDLREGFSYGKIPVEHAIKGFFGMTLSEECTKKTEDLLVSQLEHVKMDEKNERTRFSASKRPGDFVDILCLPDELRGSGGYGTVHHVAFATKDITTQKLAREKLIKNGFNVTPIIDRQYFHSIYFREPGGVLFEIATCLPGFTVDESQENLGKTLKLPSWEEKNRSKIEGILPPLTLEGIQ